MAQNLRDTATNWNQNQYGNQYPQQNQYNNNNNNNNWQQQRPPQQQQYNNNYNQQRPPQQQYNNNNNNYNQRPPQQQYNNNNNYNQRPPPQQQAQQQFNNNQNYNNNNTNTNNWQPQQTQQQPTQSTPSKPKKRGRSGSKPMPYKVTKILDRFGGIFGILAIICGIAAILCMIISMSIDEITSREYSTSVSNTCGFSKQTMCGQFTSSFISLVIDVDCDTDWTGCCSFKMKDMCDETDFYCQTDDCIYCHNMKAGNMFLLTSIISFIIICIATIAICFGATRKRFVALGLFILAIITIIIGLIAYPAMLGNNETASSGLNENGCGDSQLCCYYTDCDDDDDNCPTPPGQTYTGEIVAIVICVLAVIFLILSNRCSK